MVLKSHVEHIPVLRDEVIESLHIIKGKQFIDATLGAGGHTIEIVKKGGKVLGIETDGEMLEIAKNNLKIACPPRNSEFAGRYKLIKGNFKNIFSIAKENGFTKVDGIVYDLGVSTLHYKSIDRGFSFMKREEKLDMRLDPETLSVSAYELVNALSEKQLQQLFNVSMKLAEARSISHKIVEKRTEKEIRTVGDLVNTIGGRVKRGKVHPATKAFLALRIAVNDELGVIKESLEQAVKLLKSGGKIVTISFHSAEDKAVREAYESLRDQGLAEIPNDKGVPPSEDEVRVNPNSRSARLRILVKR